MLRDTSTNFVSQASIDNERFLLGLGHIVVTLLALYRYLKVLFMGQALSIAGSAITEALGEVSRSRWDELRNNKREKAELRSLQKKFSKKCTVRPLDAFDINFSTGLSALGLCLTYIIVLLQFKVGEVST